MQSDKRILGYLYGFCEFSCGAVTTVFSQQAVHQFASLAFLFASLAFLFMIFPRRGLNPVSFNSVFLEYHSRKSPSATMWTKHSHPAFPAPVHPLSGEGRLLEALLMGLFRVLCPAYNSAGRHTSFLLSVCAILLEVRDAVWGQQVRQGHQAANWFLLVTSEKMATCTAGKSVLVVFKLAGHDWLGHDSLSLTKPFL